jgi:hypothetical protein
VNLKNQILDAQHSLSIGKVERLLLSLSKEDADALRSSLQDLKISTRTIEKVLRKNGHAVGRGSIDNWRHTNVKGFETRSNHYMGENSVNI